MARQTNWEIFCCMCGTELQYKRVMEQSPNGGNLRYIEEEIGFVCKPCLDGLPDAKPPVPHTPPKREPADPIRRAPAPGADAGPLRGNW